MVVGAGAFKTNALSAGLSVSFLLMAGIVSQAQTPTPVVPSAPAVQASPQPRPLPGPMPGFVSPFEIIGTARSAGFHPMSPPLREGTIYVLRATDFRGIPMRVVLDARTGMIRNATPLVTSAAYGMMAPPPYGSRPYAAAPYGAPYGSPAGYDVSVPRGEPLEQGAAPSPSQPAAVSTISRAPTAAQPSLPPLPRSRPAVLAAKTPDSPANSGQATKPSRQGSSGKAQAPVGANANQTSPGPNGGAQSPSAVPSKQFPL
jgi:hypothetical protein